MNKSNFFIYFRYKRGTEILLLNFYRVEQKKRDNNHLLLSFERTRVYLFSFTGFSSQTFSENERKQNSYLIVDKVTFTLKISCCSRLLLEFLKFELLPIKLFGFFCFFQIKAYRQASYIKNAVKINEGYILSFRCQRNSL
jgi:hypothetical protein